jgi:hypothetical protein
MHASWKPPHSSTSLVGRRSDQCRDLLKSKYLTVSSNKSSFLVPRSCFLPFRPPRLFAFVTRLRIYHIRIAVLGVPTPQCGPVCPPACPQHNQSRSKIVGVEPASRRTYHRTCCPIASRPQRSAQAAPSIVFGSVPLPPDRVQPRAMQFTPRIRRQRKPGPHISPLPSPSSTTLQRVKRLGVASHLDYRQ